MSRKKSQQQPRCFVFTQETIKLAQEAMRVFAQGLLKLEREKQDEKVAFARETMQQVNSKLDALRTSVDVIAFTTFDYNEKIVIATAIQIYAVHLLATPLSTQRQRKLQLCQQIMRGSLGYVFRAR